MNMDKRVGFACKMVSPGGFLDKKQEKTWLENHNLKSTTVTSLSGMSNRAAVAKLIMIIEHNCATLIRQFEILGKTPKNLRMMRIGSDTLPCFTHENINPLYQDMAVIRAMRGLAKVGETARKYDIRLSMHPGQFSMLASNGESTIDRSIEDLEYHAEIFRLMGYDSGDNRQAINIHGGARRDEFLPEFMTNFARLSRDTQSWLSVENDEFSYCLDQLLPLADRVKICLDLHHYWIHQGKYLASDDARLQTVVESWRGVRPKLHVSWSREDVLPDHDPNVLPDMALLETQGFKKSKLRAHSETCWNKGLNLYFGEFWNRFDLMAECKQKNHTARELLNSFKI
jgi:UV DNA damage repair endonuclease